MVQFPGSSTVDSPGSQPHRFCARSAIENKILHQFLRFVAYDALYSSSLQLTFRKWDFRHKFRSPTFHRSSKLQPRLNSFGHLRAPARSWLKTTAACGLAGARCENVTCTDIRWISSRLVEDDQGTREHLHFLILRPLGSTEPGTKYPRYCDIPSTNPIGSREINLPK